MKKLSTILIFLSSIELAYAAQDASEGIGKILYNMFGFLFVDMSRIAGSRFFEFIMRFLLWIVLFACLFYAARFIFKDQKRIQVAVSFVIALIATIMIPYKVITMILTTYQIFAAAFFFLLPTAGIIFLIHKTFGTPERHNYAIKAILFYVLAMLIYTIGGVAAMYNFPGFENWLGLAEGICLIMVIWNLIRAMFPPGGPDTPPSGDMFDKIRDKESKPAEVKQREGEIADKKDAQTTKDAAATTEAVKEIKDAKDKEQNYEKYLNNTLKKEEDLLEQLKKLRIAHQNLENELRKQLAQDKNLLKNLRERLRYIISLKDAVHNSLIKIIEVEKEIKNGNMYNTKEAQEHRKKLVDYMTQCLMDIEQVFKVVAQQILDEYQRIIVERKEIKEMKDEINKVLEDAQILERLNMAESHSSETIGILEGKIAKNMQTIRKHGSKNFTALNLLKEHNLEAQKLITIIKSFQEKKNIAKSKLLELTGNLERCIIDEDKNVKDRLEIYKKNKIIVKECNEIILGLITRNNDQQTSILGRNVNEKKLAELNNKLKELYDKSNLDANKIFMIDELKKKEEEFIKAWNELGNIEKQIADHAGVAQKLAEHLILMDEKLKQEIEADIMLDQERLDEDMRSQGRRI